MMQISSRYLHNIYCDDIRQEVGNKMTFAGVYNGTLSSKNDVLVLPKFCIVSSLGTPKSDPVKKLKFIVKFNNEVIHEIESFDTPVTKEKTESDILMYGALIMISPFSIKEEGIINIVAETDREELIGNSLKIVFEKREAKQEN